MVAFLSISINIQNHLHSQLLNSGPTADLHSNLMCDLAQVLHILVHLYKNVLKMCYKLLA